MSQDDVFPALKDLFETGLRLTEELSRQNERLRQRVAELEQRPSGDLEASGQTPERELRAQLAALDAQHRELAQQLDELERQNSNYLSLYVASSQIHASLDLEDVLKNIKEIIINLIGADCFSVYLFNESTREFRRMAGEGQLDPIDAVIPFGDNLLTRVATSGSLCLDAAGATLPSGAIPIAVLPLRVGRKIVGVVSVFRLLVQKSDFDPFDMELFNLLSAHAATALLSSSMYRRLERKNKTLHGLLELFKAGGAPVPGSEG